MVSISTNVMVYQGFQPVSKKTVNTIRETISPTLDGPLDEGVSFADPACDKYFVAGGAMEAMTAPAAITGDTDKMETPSQAAKKPPTTRNTAVTQAFKSVIPSNGYKDAPRKRRRSGYVASINGERMTSSASTDPRISLKRIPAATA